jgi:hypothetical protein
MTTLDGTKAYVVGEDFSLRGAVRLDPSDYNLPFEELARGEIQPAEPVQFKPVEGRKPTDFVGTTLGTLFVVSGAFVDTLRKNGFTGWSTFPVVISPKKGVELRGYTGLAVTGRCGAIDESLSQPIRLEPFAPGGETTDGLRGMYFDPSSWDGSDIFTPAGTSFVCVAPSVRQALLDAGAAVGCDFRLMSEMTWWPLED